MILHRKLYKSNMLIYILKMSSEDALNESNLKLDYLVLKQAIS